ncbi:MAG: universal stress protein [Desulfobacterales bacterium]
MDHRDRFSIFYLADFSAAGRIAFAHALKIALTFGAELSIVLTKAVNATEKNWPYNPPVRSTLEQWKILRNGSRRAAVLHELGIAVKKIDRNTMNPSAAIAYHLEKHSVDLIVLSAHFQAHLLRQNHDTPFLNIIQQTHAQILFIPERTEGFVSPTDGTVSLANIMVPVTQKPHPESAIKDAGALGYVMGKRTVNISLVHVGEADGIPAVQLPAYDGCSWNQVLRNGEAADEISALAYVLPADLIVMTTDGRTADGCSPRESVTARVLQKAPCPVLIISA